MSGPQGRRPAESPSCPLLGLPDDPLTRFSYPSVAHRCRASDRPQPIDLGHQDAFCLAATYPDCPRYQAAATLGRPGAMATAPRPTVAKPGDPVAVARAKAVGGSSEEKAAAPAVNSVTTPGIPSAAGIPPAPGIPSAPDRPTMPWTLDRPARPASPVPVSSSAPTDRPDRTDPPPATRGRRVVVVVVAIAVLVVLAVAAYLASPAIGDWVRQVGASAPSAGASPVVSRSASPAPSLTTPLPDPSRAPDQSPAAAPTPTPTPTRAATPIIHVVAKGEYLIRIAARYGVPVDAIIRANRITDPSLIYVGERLLIPPP
jgi:LysM repeat protein